MALASLRQNRSLLERYEETCGKTLFTKSWISVRVIDARSRQSRLLRKEKSLKQ